MQNFGRFVDDIREHHPDITVVFLLVNGRDTMTITTIITNETVSIDSKNVGDIEYDTPAYEELLDMTIESLGGF